MKRILVVILCCLSFSTLAASDEPPIALEKVRVNIHDKASLERGAQFFAQNCMTCHTMRYLQHNKIAKKAGITLDKMPLKNKEWWLGITPPDLTLIAAQRGPNWLYTYFHSFYKDPNRPTGFNNLLFKNVNMLNVFAAYQGQQELAEPADTLFKSMKFNKPRYYTILKLVKAGSMSPEQFDQATKDLTNFLVYASEPKRIDREHLGWWVLGFLAILALLSYFLYREYWKDIK